MEWQKSLSNIPWRRLLPIMVVVVLMGIVFLQGWHKQLSLSALIENSSLLHRFVADNIILMLIAYAAIYILIVTLSLPASALFTISGGFLFGWFLGGLTALIAATIGAVCLFLIIKTALGATLRERAGPWMIKFSQGFQDHAFHYLLFLRLVPVFPFWLVNVAPAILGMRLRAYIAATLLGIVPGSFAFALIGSGLDSVIEAQREANADCMDQVDCVMQISVSDLVTPQLLIAFGVLAVVALIPVVLKKLRGQKPL